MFKAFALVRNLESHVESLDFGEFTIGRVGLRHNELREGFSSVDVNRDDWIFEKSYAQLPLGPPGSPVGGIPNDIEDILLLLRLYKVGDISFIKLAIIPPSGNRIVQFPYRAMNDLNSYSPLRFNFESNECQPWKEFADGIRESQSWRSNWFGVARRFFLYGGAKEFNPKWDDVDRILDYAALESTLVPEKDYNTQRISRRAAALIAPGDPVQTEEIRKLVNRFYDIRSRIVHGDGLSDENREWLFQNCCQVEFRVRQVLVTAVQKLPPVEEDRRVALAGLYDPTDEDRGNSAFAKFKEIKTAAVRKAIATKVASLAGDGRDMTWHRSAQGVERHRHHRVVPGHENQIQQLLVGAAPGRRPSILTLMTFRVEESMHKTNRPASSPPEPRVGGFPQVVPWRSLYAALTRR